MRLTFRRAQRLTRSRDFQEAYRSGGRARGQILQVIALENDRGTTRLGLSVGRAIWKSAVRRNRVRRIFREAFRLEQARLPAGFDLVLVPAEKRLEPELAATREELVRLAERAAQKARAKRAGPGPVPPGSAAPARGLESAGSGAPEDS